MPLPATPTRLTIDGQSYQSPAGTLQDQWVRGMSGNNAILGGDGNDRLEGGEGDDSLTGGAGNDLLLGDIGNDSLAGGDGDDRLIGGDGDDSLSGGTGNDTIYGGGGQDRLDGGAGNDVLVAATDLRSGGVAADLEIRGGTGFDTLVLEGQTWDKFWSVQNVERFAGSALGDILDFTTYRANGFASFGDDATQPAGVTADGRAGNDSILGTAFDDKLYGDVGNDTLAGGGGADRLNGGDGDDSMSGGTGNDTLDGGNGINRLNGNDGDDFIRAEMGYNFVDAGAGDDVISIAAGGMNAQFGYINGGDGYDTLRINSGGLPDNSIISGVERIVASDAGGTFDFSRMVADSGTTTGVRFDGGSRSDIVTGTAFGDRLSGGDGYDQLFGRGGNDTLNGGAGQDFIDGGDGDDVFIASAGQDMMGGGAGRDTFDLRTLEAGWPNQAVIEDFHRGEDIINLRGLGLNYADFTLSQGQMGSAPAVSIMFGSGADAKFMILLKTSLVDMNADMFLL
jgi:Ca2+-binding RTX toxin-like protein